MLASLAAVLAAPAVQDRPCPALEPPSGPVPVRFHRPSAAAPAGMLDAWCSAVGPAIVDLTGEDGGVGSDIVVVSWNVHGDAGDIGALVASLRDGTLLGSRGDAYRPAAAGGGSPRQRDSGNASRGSADCQAAGSKRGEPVGRSRDSTCARTESGVCAVDAERPRSGRSRKRHTLDASVRAVDAFELPFGRQRRVAVAATIRGAPPGGGRCAWFRFISIPGMARQRGAGTVAPAPGQGAGRLAGRGHHPTVIGGDLNTWWGAR